MGTRSSKFIGLLAAWFGVYLAIGVVVGLLFGAGNAGGTQLELEQQQQTAQSVAQLLGIGTTLVIGAFLAPKVGYRSRDTWMQLDPDLEPHHRRQVAVASRVLRPPLLGARSVLSRGAVQLPVPASWRRSATR